MSDNFKKYMHIERLGTTEVEHITEGDVYVFPKIDGTNASVWWDDGIMVGSRNRVLSSDNDNAGFYKYATNDDKLMSLCGHNKHLILYGEWLVPHSLKSYRTEAWRKFYVFDVFDKDKDIYVPFNDYVGILESYGIEFVPYICHTHNITEDRIKILIVENTYLLDDGSVGEGIVIKNYDYVNRFGRTVWAKVVRNEFKDRHRKTNPVVLSESKPDIEYTIACKYVTEALCEKVKAKIELSEGHWSSKMIGNLLGRVFYDIVREETWNYVKEHKYPTIDYNKLRRMVTLQVKERMKNLF